MPDPRVSLHLLTADNPYPDCVAFKLETPSQGTHPSITEQLPLLLSIHFNEQEKSLLNGHLKFGIKGGTLTLQLENGEMINPQLSLEDWGQLTTMTSEAVVWQLASPSGVSILKTESILSSVAIVQPTTHFLDLTLTLEVTPPDISITSAQGLWRHDIHPNKHGILERVLAHFLAKTRLSPHLCQIQWTSDQGKARLTRENQPRGEIDPQALAQLHQRLDRLYTANTSNLYELAELGNLDPLKDLGGGSFLAAELSGVELSGARLSRTNFRGANLTDADLSEALLNYSRFSGADLSGAYLGNAQFVGADCYRASLALANLIGANLTGANLQEANLSQTNLAGARVTGAKFGENPGMTEEMKESLLERGGIFLGNS